MKRERAMQHILALSVAGMFFSGYLTITELTTECTGGCIYWGIIPTCFYGLVMFAAIATLAVYGLNKNTG